MIYTLTFNPAIDYVVEMGELIQGEVNRTHSEKTYWGGKGINVSVILKELDTDNAALGFTAGFTGTALDEGLKEDGIKTDFVRLGSGMTRINTKIKAKDSDGKPLETDLNAQGPVIDDAAVSELYKKLDRLESGDTLVMAGSIPTTMAPDSYEKIMKCLDGKGIRFVVDATKDLLLNSLVYKPFLVKPNNFELAEMFSVEINTDDEVVFYAKKLREMGARNVLVSMAAKGSILVDETDCVNKLEAIKGKVKNSVGAGDSMVAGFLAGWEKQHDYLYAMKLGSAAGSATAFSDGLASKSDILKLFNTII